MVRNKRVIITEDMEMRMLKHIFTESIIPGKEKVLRVKEYLDSNYSREVSDDIDDNGNPKEVHSVYFMIKGQPKEPLLFPKLLIKLEDEFPSLFKDKEDNRKFLKQCIIDWYNNKISKEGILTKNHLD